MVMSTSTHMSRFGFASAEYAVAVVAPDARSAALVAAWTLNAVVLATICKVPVAPDG